MSSSTYTIHPSLLDNNNSSKDGTWPAADLGTPDYAHQEASATSLASNHLSPYSQIPCSSVSRAINNAITPVDSSSAISEHYQSSDLSELDTDADPFFGVDFNVDGGTPSFLDDQDSSDYNESTFSPSLASRPTQNASELHAYPLSPDPTTPSIHTTSPISERRSPRVPGEPLPGSVSLQAHPKWQRSVSSDPVLKTLAPQFYQGANTSLRSSEEDITTAAAPMPSPSPRVTVSMWGRDQVNMDSVFPENVDSPTTVRAGVSADDNLISASYQRSSATTDEYGTWGADSRPGPRGWGPESRSADEGISINEQAVRRKISERNQEVNKWIASSEGGISPETPAASPVPVDPFTTEDDGISPREISLGHQTENKPLPGQTYYTETGGYITQEDIELMRQHPLWSDSPGMFRITKESSQRQQPETSKAAMERFEQMYQDTSSVLSRAATWGTRRRSLPSIADMEGITSGSFLKKLSISRDRKPSILFKELRGLVRKPSGSQLKKRNHSVPAEDEASSYPDSLNRRESQRTLALPGRSTSFGKKQHMPSLNTALLSMGTGAAAIGGARHIHRSSVSNVSSPRSPSTLQVKNILNRRRSKSELPKGTSDESHPNLVGMWKSLSGGPPVAQLAKRYTTAEQDEDEDEDEDEEDDMYEASDAKAGSNVIDDITPTLAGFREQVLIMNPRLEEHHTYLIDRIAHQQVIRYKSLLTNKVRHLQNTSTRACACRSMCMALGGSANLLNVKGESRGLDPLSAIYDDSEGGETPLEGVLTAECFPPDIPMPPTSTLPAEFECQICYQAKKFMKPSDWTKHVHEDVQPFTCTWDRCREPKIFKRKADWVRHENEGHRHLEWWICDVEECRHICYRRDNFLQHLVREHKYPEPKVKTKAAVKKSGGSDPTWQKVERCHVETTARPQDEPCRFCGKTLPTWKKLTVHLAKHMENMSLPILRVVARKELDMDTVISPVQDPPPRTFPPVSAVKTEPPSFNPSPKAGHSPMQHQKGVLDYSGPQHSSFAYQAPGTFHDAFYDSSMHGLQQSSEMNVGMNQPVIGVGFQGGQAGYQNLPTSTGAFMAPSSQYISISQQVEPFPAFMNHLGLQDASASGHQVYDTTLNPASAGGQQFSPTGSISPYSRSPHQGPGGFYPPQ